jgi:hypothetical protein
VHARAIELRFIVSYSPFRFSSIFLYRRPCGILLNRTDRYTARRVMNIRLCSSLTPPRGESLFALRVAQIRMRVGDADYTIAFPGHEELGRCRTGFAVYLGDTEVVAARCRMRQCHRIIPVHRLFRVHLSRASVSQSVEHPR